MASEGEITEFTPAALASSIPQKRVLDEAHSPAVSSPLNPEGKLNELHAEDNSQQNRFKSARAKKDSFKKREAKGADSARATPEPKGHKDHKEPERTESSPLRYKLAPPKPSDFEQPRGPALISHHRANTQDGEIEFFETSEQ